MAQRCWKMQSSTLAMSAVVREVIPDALYDMKTEDGVYYSVKEVARIERAEIPVPIEVHILKKVFGGEIVRVERHEPRLPEFILEKAKEQKK
jgi:hypothetical protein